MSRRPSFQFYPADWRSNANLRRCSHAARGAWMDILCVLHDSDEYGMVRWPLSDLASAAGVPLKLARELLDKNVLKGSDKGPCEAFTYTPRSGRKDGPPVTLIAEQQGPIWYSSRMVKDEYVRTIRGDGDTPKISPKPSPKPPIGETIGGDIGPRTRAPSSSSSSSPAGESTPSLRSGVCAEPPAAHAPEAASVISLPTNREGEEVGISQAQVDEFAKLYPAVDVDQQLRAMRAWLLANRAKRKTARGMMRFVNSWLSKEQDKPSGQGQRGQVDRQARPRTSGSGTFFDSCVESARDELAASRERYSDQGAPRGTVAILPPPRDDARAGEIETEPLLIAFAGRI